MSHLFLSSKQVLQVDDVSVKTTGRGGTKAGRVGEEERCNCFIPRRVKPRAAWRILAQRVPPNACIVVSSRGKAMGPFHIALEKKIKEKYSHRLSRDCDRPSNFPPNKTTRQGAADQPFCFYLSSRSAPCNNNCMVH